MPRRRAASRRSGRGSPGRPRRGAGPAAFAGGTAPGGEGGATPPVPPVGIVGAGRAGLALAVALRRARVAVAGVHARHARPAPAGIRLSVGGLPPWLPRVGVVVCAVGDDALGTCARELAAGGAGPGLVVLHLSGALTADALAPLAARGAATGSMHPLMTFGPDPVRAARALRGASFALEGDVAAVAVADAMVRRLGGVSLPLAPELKPRYHAGAVFASNYLVTMLATAVRLLEEAGLAPDAALTAVAPLARTTVENAAAGPAAALTGPVLRGDVATIRRHLAALDPATAELYRAVGRATLALARRSGGKLDEGGAALLAELFR